MRRSRLAAALALLGLLASCRSSIGTSAIDPALASCIPPGTIAIAGANLEELRASPLVASLPLVEPFHDARWLLAAWSGKDLLIAANRERGARPSFSGAPDAVRAARQQEQTGAPGAPALLAEAEPLAAAGNQLWAVVRGNVNLPLTGNLANVNRLLRNMEFAAVTLRLSSAVEFGVTARGATAEAARSFEDTLRATLTMAAAGETRRGDFAALLRSVQVRREDRTVHASLVTTPERARLLLQTLAR